MKYTDPNGNDCTEEVNALVSRLNEFMGSDLETLAPAAVESAAADAKRLSYLTVGSGTRVRLNLIHSPNNNLASDALRRVAKRQTMDNARRRAAESAAQHARESFMKDIVTFTESCDNLASVASVPFTETHHQPLDAGRLQTMSVNELVRARSKAQHSINSARENLKRYDRWHKAVARLKASESRTIIETLDLLESNEKRIIDGCKGDMATIEAEFKRREQEQERERLNEDIRRNPDRYIKQLQDQLDQLRQ